MAKKKLTEDELMQINYYRKQRSNMIQQLGNMEVAVLNLQKEKEKGLEAINSLDQSEQQFYRVLQDKYGQGRLDIEAGEFISD